jgi:HEPN domain-containing protein
MTASSGALGQPSIPSATLGKPQRPKNATPLTPSDFKTMARTRLREAKILLQKKEYGGAVYLCGYSIEFALKARICRTFGWPEYKISKGYETFKTHELEVLLDLSGIRPKINRKYFAEWSAVDFWWSELRYEPISKIDPQVATDMISAAGKLLIVM